MLPWMILIGLAAVTNSGGEHHGPPPEYRGYRIVLVEASSSWSFSADPVTPDLPILAYCRFAGFVTGEEALLDAKKQIDLLLAH